MLGLGHLRWQATQEEIRVAYRKVAKEHHPDKTENHDDTMFKAVAAAFETLGDAKKRRDYDSADPFDDAIPSPDSVVSDADFYRIYGPVFKNNAKWSKKTPVPELGDASTPYSQLEQFYNFWLKFQSWREYAFLNEYEPEQAESREEKRWMERQNAKLQADRRKEDSARLSRLVEQAYARDPRIRARKAEFQAEKDRQKQEKKDEKRRAREEQERKAAEAEAEKKRLEDEAKAVAAAAKAEREKAKKAAKKKRQELRQFGEAHGISFEIIEVLCEKCTMERYEYMLSDAANDAEGTKKKILAELESFKSEEERRKEAEEMAKIQRAEEARRALAEKDVKWTNEELGMLTKALARFPGGSMNRWAQIAAYMNHTKTEEEIIAKVKSVKNKDLKEKPPATRETEDAFQRFLREKKDVQVVSPHSVRYELSEDSSSAAPTPSSSAPVSSSTTPTPVVTTSSTPKPETTTTAPKATPKAAANPPAATSSTPAIATATTTSAQKEWSAAEQSALEAALKKYPASTENRWDVIASAVPGRSKKECVERYKYLVSIVKAGKK